MNIYDTVDAWSLTEDDIIFSNGENISLTSVEDKGTVVLVSGTGLDTDLEYVDLEFGPDDRMDLYTN